MSTDIVDEPLSASYDFCDAKNAIIVTLYAHGAFEVKDIDISIETDSLEVRTPGKLNCEKLISFVTHNLKFLVNERWLFRLWEHVYVDQVDIQTQPNSALTQTSIEIRLIKQQPRKTWPQLYSNDSIPITPQRDDQMNDGFDIVSEKQYDLSLKKLRQDFYETNETFTSNIYIKQVYDCQVNFTETNFTATFHTK